MEKRQEERLLERLRNGADALACGVFLRTLTPLQRSELCTALVFDRLGRKMRTVEALHREAAGNWNQTFYLLYFRTLGDLRNREAFLTLARQVPYRFVLRERQAPHAVEAMLLGASGLLAGCAPGPCTHALEEQFRHLSAKYEIEPMDAAAWSLNGIRPANHPVLRIVQAAAFFVQDEFVMSRTMDCRNEQDIRRLFCIDAPEYWQDLCGPENGPDRHARRIGTFKAHIIGINLVAVLQFAFGSSTGSDAMRDNALTLLERLAAEDNRYMRAWRSAGIDPSNAFESQALLQLATEYCAAKRCGDCPVGRRTIRKAAQTMESACRS